MGRNHIMVIRRVGVYMQSGSDGMGRADWFLLGIMGRDKDSGVYCLDEYLLWHPERGRNGQGVDNQRLGERKNGGIHNVGESQDLRVYCLEQHLHQRA